MSTQSETDRKIEKLLRTLLAQEEKRALLEATLFDAGYKVLPRVEFMSLPLPEDSGRLKEARDGIILDVETTGVDTGADEVIQLSMQRIRYDRDGILELGEIFDRYRDPGIPIPEEVTRITGITDDIVRGEVIDEAEVADFIAGCDLVVAHNAGFDRKFVERVFPGAGFDRIGWHCSVEQIDWKGRGASDAKLEGLARFCGFTYDAHNSRSDILATAFVLNHASKDGRMAFAEMHAAGMSSPLQVIAKGTPFSAKEDLKGQGYRWCPDSEQIGGYSKVWHKTIPGDPEVLREESAFLEDIFGKSVVLPALVHTPMTRYSVRAGSEEIRFCTRETKSAAERMKIIGEDPSPDVSDRPAGP